MTPVIGLAAILFSATSPGTLISIDSTCTYTAGTEVKTVQASANIGITSQLSLSLQNPVYITKGYKQTSADQNGVTTTRFEDIANGWLVKFIKKSPDGTYSILEGVQLSDGRVLVDGIPVEPDL